MASNSIVLKDTTYNGVSSIELPVSGGGSALFTDVSDTTAAAADVAQGKYFYTAAGAKTAGTASGSSGDADYAAFLARSTNTPTLPSNLTVIGKNAFYGWSSLALTSLPDSVTEIGETAFYNCMNLPLASLPSSLRTIGYQAFSQCSKITASTMPNGVTTIGTAAFQGCSKVAFTSLPNSITAIGSNAFYGCSSLAITSLPSNLARVDTSTFESCTGIVLTSLPSSLTVISTGAFRNCTGLVNISCDGVLASSGMGTGAFNKCSNLVTARFPNMTQSSLSTAFGSSTASNACQNLETVDIGNTQAIAANAFANCYKLQTLVLRKTGSICTLANVSAFLNTPMRGYNSLTGTVYVPNALISTYKTATNWKTLYDGGTLTFAAIEGSQYEL